jgi:hypothetical protein
MTTPNSSDSVPAVATAVLPQVPVSKDSKGRLRMSKDQ